ncbi:hypothetical protein MPDQ_000571 [Monascus purpureus]|uniref:Uncharacterized protein n=1 Tax=Monascus purpureus TaxID=5098 RepID=A0A507R1U0_MONPU|nr:hypothetical protein MPDQ_000571 [Monascus purpureus]
MWPGEDLGEYFLRQRCSSHYIQPYNKIQEEDQPLSKTEKDENNYFQNKNLRNTIAKKLTLMSEWKTQYTVKNLPRLRKDMFVTSPKLWKWVQRFMQDWEDGILMRLPKIKIFKRMRSTGTSHRS